MPKTRQQKEDEVSLLKGAIADSASAVFVAFNKMPIDEEQGLRRDLKQSGVAYRVTKKTLFNRALSLSKMEGDDPGWDKAEGWQFALAYGDDPVAPAKGIAKFAKDHEEQMMIIGGVYEGKVMNMSEMNEIALIPDLQTLRGMFVNLINSPVQGLAVVLNGIAESKS